MTGQNKNRNSGPKSRYLEITPSSQVDDHGLRVIGTNPMKNHIKGNI